MRCFMSQSLCFQFNPRFRLNAEASLPRIFPGCSSRGRLRVVLAPTQPKGSCTLRRNTNQAGKALMISSPRRFLPAQWQKTHIPMTDLLISIMTSEDLRDADPPPESMTVYERRSVSNGSMTHLHDTFWIFFCV